MTNDVFICRLCIFYGEVSVQIHSLKKKNKKTGTSIFVLVKSTLYILI